MEQLSPRRATDAPRDARRLPGALRVALCLSALASCAPPATTPAPTTDARVDAPPVDAASLDAASVDAAPVDAASVDMAPVDAAPADATTVEALRAQLEALARRFVGEGTIEVAPAGTAETVPRLPTLVLGVVSPRLTAQFTLARAGAAVPTTRTVYPISSISKMFTGLVAARGVVAGDFAADVRARDLLAADLGPLVGDRTLLELLTHTAGYRPNPTNFTGAPESPAAGYTRAQLASCLAVPACSAAMRGNYVYSNLGAGLAGLALTDRYREDYDTLVAARLTRELGMVDTHTRAASDASRIVGGFTRAGASVQPATMGVLASAGELLSTGDDLARLVGALVRPPPSLAAAVTLATTPSAPAPRVGFAIDVISRRGLELRAKSGEQAGYSSLVMWAPAQGLGAFALTNLGGSSTTLAALLLDALVMLRDAGP